MEKRSPTAPEPREQAAANARSLVEAARTGRFPERLNPLVAPSPFDRAAFERDPLPYFDVVEPGRVWQTAESGPNVKTLEAEGPAHLETEPQGSVKLSVIGEPNAPVTFTSFDRGAFENDLSSITVLSNSAGEARVRFTATLGTIEDVNILSASPLSAGQVAFLVTVKRD